MTLVEKLDGAVESGSARLGRLSEQAAGRGGVAGKIAPALADDAAFLRKLRPSLIRARLKGAAPEDEPAAAIPVPEAPRAAPRARRSGGPNPFPVIAAAAIAGVVIAKALDSWGHAHPRG